MRQEIYTVREGEMILPMKSKACIIMTILILLFGSTAAWGDIYRWVDDKGAVHFSDQPPAQEEGSHGLESMPSAPPSSVEPTPTPNEPPAASAPVDEGAAEPAPAQQKTRAETSSKVELYVTSWCPYCKKAKSYFRSRNIPFDEYDIEKDPQAARRRQALDKRSGVPLAVINGYVIIGYSEENYELALNSGKK